MTMLMMGTLVLSGVTALVGSTTTAEAKVTYVCKLSKQERQAKKWIAMKESGGNYRARTVFTMVVTSSPGPT